MFGVVGFGMQRTAAPGAELTRPLPLLALGLLVLNDHVLKGAGPLPGWLTGKLSDFAGLFLFPVLLSSLSGLAADPGRERRARGAALATALGFSLVKLSPEVNRLASATLGPIVLDPSDLLALPMTLLAYLWLCHAPASPARAGRLGRTLALVASSAACLATSRPQTTRGYPSWRLEHLGARDVGCATVDAWVSKSGKQGVGVTLQVKAAQAACEAQVRSASLRIGERVIPTSKLPGPLLGSAREQYVYLPFAFDNEALWNQGERLGKLELEISTGSETQHIVLAMRHVLAEPHPAEPRPDVPQAPRDGRAPLIMVEPSTTLTPEGGAP